MNSCSNLVFTRLLVTMMVSVWKKCLAFGIECWFFAIRLTCILAHSNEKNTAHTKKKESGIHCTGTNGAFASVRNEECQIENPTGSNTFSRLFSFVSPANRSVLFIHINLYLYLSILTFVLGFWTLCSFLFVLCAIRTPKIQPPKRCKLLKRCPSKSEYAKPLPWT